METILMPGRERWMALCQRPVKNSTDLEATVRDIIEKVRSGSDEALLSFSGIFDGYVPDKLKVSLKDIELSADMVPQPVKEAIYIAKANIEKFHSSQVIQEPVIETTKGVKCWRKSVPIEKVGLYIPGGSAPLFSTLLMLGIPAKLAGCKEVVVCSPPGKDGKISPFILFTAGLLGIEEIFRVGGAQAIAAMAYGTATIPRVYKVFGPGNQFVTRAKELVQLDGIAIDMPAGPSEVLVIADASANAEFIGADLLSQAEHGPDSQVILATDSPALADRVKTETLAQADKLSRRDIIFKALSNSRLIVLPSIPDCIEFSNMYAPEHLIINTAGASADAEKITNAGSVFLGEYSCESAGDYASGTNHTLPTNGFARNYSGISTESFMKKITFQEISSDGIKMLGPVIEIMAESESLTAHRNAVSLRLKSINND
jgi:histidinol dehydrogenase